MTGLTAKKRWVVPLVCGVTVGPELGKLLKVAGVGSKLPEQAMATRATVPAPAAAIERERERWFLLTLGSRVVKEDLWVTLRLIAQDDEVARWNE